MGRTRTLICWAYALTAAAALVMTYAQFLPFPAGGWFGFIIGFWPQMRVNQAARGISVDIAFFMLAAALFMITEARRLKVRHVWLYLVFAYMVDVSVVFPIFMIVRERAMARAGEHAADPTVTDLVALAATGGVLAWQVWVVLQ